MRQPYSNGTKVKLTRDGHGFRQGETGTVICQTPSLSGNSRYIVYMVNINGREIKVYSDEVKSTRRV